jgi:hypothetical protein
MVLELNEVLKDIKTQERLKLTPRDLYPQLSRDEKTKNDFNLVFKQKPQQMKTFNNPR